MCLCDREFRELHDSFNGVFISEKTHMDDHVNIHFVVILQ